MAEDNDPGLAASQSRRELLKKLGVTAGALVWTTPIVQTISMATASAQQFQPQTGGGGTTTTTPSSIPSKLSATCASRAQWWDDHGDQGAWVAKATFSFNYNRHAYLTVQVTKKKVNNQTTTTTTNDFYVPANGSAPLEVYDLPYKEPSSGNDIKSVTFKVTKIRTYTSNWTEQSFTVSSPSTTCTWSGTPPTTTTSTSTTTTAPTTTSTTTVGGGGGGGHCHDISHLDLIVRPSNDSSKRYGIQWDPGEGWSKHPTSSKHCLESSGAWTQPPSSFLSGFPTPTFNASTGSYTVTFPSSVKVLEAYSKAGQGCQPAVNITDKTYGSSSTWRFDKWCDGSTTTTSTTTSTTHAPTTTSTTTVGGGSGGSPGPTHDISHMDLIVRKVSSGPHGTWYGVQYDFGEGWSKHPKGSKNKEHCLYGLRTWSGSVPSSVMSLLTSTAVPKGNGKYMLEIPTSLEIRPALLGSGYTYEAFSKCAKVCHPATVVVVGSTRQITFSPCPKDD